jgi:Carboxypeptidase regulatory-like domain
MRKTLFLIAAIVAVLVGVTSSNVFAQATGTIAGIVTDETGAVIPGVTIEVINVGTSISRTAVTSEDGYYSVPLLQPGPYQVKATLPGFKSTIREGVSVTV